MRFGGVGAGAGRHLIELLRTISPTILDVNGLLVRFAALPAAEYRGLGSGPESTKKCYLKVLTPRPIWHRSNVLFPTICFRRACNHAKELIYETNCLFGGLLPGVVGVAVERLPACSKYESTRSRYQSLTRKS